MDGRGGHRERSLAGSLRICFLFLPAPANAVVATFSLSSPHHHHLARQAEDETMRLFLPSPFHSFLSLYKKKEEEKLRRRRRKM